MVKIRTHYLFHRQEAANVNEKTNSGAPSLVQGETQPSLGVTLDMDIDKESSKADQLQEANRLEDEKADEFKNNAAKCPFNEEVDDGVPSLVQGETQSSLESILDIDINKESSKADRLQEANRPEDEKVDGFENSGAKHLTEEGALSLLGDTRGTYVNKESADEDLLRKEASSQREEDIQPSREGNYENIADLKDSRSEDDRDSNPHGTYFVLIEIHTNCSFLLLSAMVSL
jgi:hypothetical protein